MKTRNWIVAAAMLVALSGANDLLAQTHLDALIKQCESMKDVVIEEVYSKDKKTKKPERRITTIHFSSTKQPKLLDDFLKAFAQDKEAAYKVIEKKRNGKMTPSFYQYTVGTSDVSYSLSDEDAMSKYAGDAFKREEDISITRIERFNENE